MNPNGGIEKFDETIISETEDLLFIVKLCIVSRSVFHYPSFIDLNKYIFDKSI